MEPSVRVQIPIETPIDANQHMEKIPQTPHNFEDVIQEDMNRVEKTLHDLGYKIREGSASPEELVCLHNIVVNNNSKTVGEIGFHTGFSSRAFLANTGVEQVVSFDIGEHEYVSAAKK